jgi:hypothetical protein
MTSVLTNYMEQSPFEDANSSPASQETPPHYIEPKGLLLHWQKSLVPILNQNNPVHALLTIFFKINLIWCVYV